MLQRKAEKPQKGKALQQPCMPLWCELLQSLHSYFRPKTPSLRPQSLPPTCAQAAVSPAKSLGLGASNPGLLLTRCGWPCNSPFPSSNLHFSMCTSHSWSDNRLGPFPVNTVLSGNSPVSKVSHSTPEPASTCGEILGLPWCGTNSAACGQRRSPRENGSHQASLPD